MWLSNYLSYLVNIVSARGWYGEMYFQIWLQFSSWKEIWLTNKVVSAPDFEGLHIYFILRIFLYSSYKDFYQKYVKLFGSKRVLLLVFIFNLLLDNFLIINEFIIWECIQWNIFISKPISPLPWFFPTHPSARNYTVVMELSLQVISNTHMPENNGFDRWSWINMHLLRFHRPLSLFSCT